MVIIDSTPSGFIAAELVILSPAMVVKWFSQIFAEQVLSNVLPLRVPISHLLTQRIGRTDRVLVAAEDGTLFAWLNDGDGANFIWEPANDGKQIFDGKCTLDRLRFADLTGSGKADVVCIMGTNNVGKCETPFVVLAPSSGFIGTAFSS